MSWSCYFTGTKDEAKTFVEQSLDASIKMYGEYGTLEGDEEAEDCRNAKRAILTAIEGMTSFEPDSYATKGYLVPKGYLVRVESYGSRSAGSVTLHAEATKVPAA